MSGHHPRNTEPMLESPLCGATVPEALSVVGGVRQKALPDAWRRAWLPRVKTERKCPEEQWFYETSR
jgi:hypothetical protein